MDYNFNKAESKLLERCKEAVAYDNNGDPMKDVLDEDDFRRAIHLLVRITKRKA